MGVVGERGGRRREDSSLQHGVGVLVSIVDDFELRTRVEFADDRVGDELFDAESLAVAGERRDGDRANIRRQRVGVADFVIAAARHGKSGGDERSCENANCRQPPH